ncbi:hypothetical protein UA08_00142 [Talaromyces atroroseus]|uniref:Uncharacterized protein n=1 Tax=Talaromyces atroroseus TaxID=1441469 RepID=A0A225B087_TALAT|nr:hypothetical protein UA08_00142 [Talaromyces atroroseus]OKL64114.1 hypothetical protein UA08_00142 [Talaromyces atroroseus]
MVYYIRFLKTPRTQAVKPGLVSVSALISVTTDLGDAFLAEDVVLQAQLIDAGTMESANSVLQEFSYKWEAGRRELAISIGPVRLASKVSRVILAIGTKSTSTVNLDTDLCDPTRVPLVISGWSAPFGVSQNTPAEKLIERRFMLQNKIQLRIWEETGNNIARHIWQNAIGSSGNCSMRQLRSHLERKSNSNQSIQAIELGSGCGIVGIALAQMLPRCSITLTDLPEVQDIMACNLQLTRSAAGSTCDFKQLDWEDERDGDNMPRPPMDLILVSDCTYNADSLPSLVRVLTRLVQASPQAVVLVSLKQRHESEAVFFELMRRAGFTIMEESAHALPAAYSEQDSIEMYAFVRA